MTTSRLILSVLFCLILSMAFSQDRRTGAVVIEEGKDGYHVRIDIPPPRTIPGARKAFDEQLIEFGDGTHSYDKNPVHIYQQGRYTIRTSIINNYDEGKPPKIPPRIIEVDRAQSDSGVSPQTFAPGDNPLRLEVFQDPMPEEEVVCVLTYRNTTNAPASGKIGLYYNENIYRTSHFEFVEARLHHGEVEVPEEFLTDASAWDLDQSLASVQAEFLFPELLSIDRQMLKAEFVEQKEWEFSNLEPGEERNIYVTLQSTSAMLKDTNATVRIAATVESNDGRIQSVKITPKQIVTSHDPNRMTVRPRKMHFSRNSSSPIEYYVKFQNHGEGPARQISVKCALSEAIDMQSLRVLEMYPPCPICPESDVSYGCLDTTWQEEGIVFTFRNIYLPGREQNLTRRDSTKGFVRFEVTPGQKLRKVPFNVRSEIIFDKNEPIRTNSAKMRFRADMRMGLLAGVHYNRIANAGSSDFGFFGGTVLAPYKPYRFYYQAEIMPVYANYEIRDATTGTLQYNFRQLRVEVVPLQVRKNLASFVGVGTGVHLSTLVYLQQEENGVKSDPEWFKDITPSVFADVNLGAVRSGLSLGARYYLNLENTGSGFWSLYLVVRR